jgi:hypothetical protein
VLNVKECLFRRNKMDKEISTNTEFDYSFKFLINNWDKILIGILVSCGIMFLVGCVWYILYDGYFISTPVPFLNYIIGE